MKTETTPRERVFQTAARLFYQNGYRATGVDTIAAESGIGKMTLYRHYTSKDDLIVAYLRHSDEAFWEDFELVTRDATSAREKLLAFFESLQNYVRSPACCGCPFLNLVAEYPEIDYPGHQVALEHKQAVRARFHQLAIETGVQKPEALADQLFLLMDGAYTAVRMYGAEGDNCAVENPAAHVLEAARILIDSQTGRIYSRRAASE